ncbi:putative mitochondrial protein AtMg00820 [Bidens hawaiensis]|uniref:putative mitochondrial protein AtMg00820 n=1 Tax=Bidens hawaiensis TaxID=980011 RepID=UPI00404B413A
MCAYADMHTSGIMSIGRYTCFLSQVEPTSFPIALQDSSWAEAIQEELQQFPIPKKWVFKCKKFDLGVIVRNKPRLVVQYFYQQEGVDYTEVYSLVARLDAICIFLAYVAFKNLKVYLMDVKNVFLNRELHEEVSVK